MDKAMSQPDFLGEFGGSLGLAFGAGCLACWTFIKAFVSGPINKSYEKRIAELEKDKHECHERVNSLELLLFVHGGGELRGAMQRALSEEHIERLQAEQKVKQV